MALRDQMVEHLATGLLNIVNLLNPDVIVLGGLLYDLHSILNGPLQESLSSRVLPIFHQEIRMEPSAHGQQAGLVGAATVALNRFVFGESQMLASKAS